MKRVSFSIPDDYIHAALKDYAATRGLRLSDLARLSLFEHIRRSPPKGEGLKKRLRDIL